MSQKIEKSNASPHWEPDRPYQNLPRLPPQADIESKAILKECISARAAVAELRRAGQILPNAAMLINILPMLEAKASSEIENIVTTADRLFQFRQAQEQADPATKEAIRYSFALMEGKQTLQNCPINTRVAEKICCMIKGFEMSVRKSPGTALVQEPTSKIIYTPPVGELLIRELLDNWASFLHESTDVDPLIRLAVSHYQFEAIHPFSDGNGRTGRVLNTLFLVEQRLLDLPVLYLSRYFIANRDEYYRRLLRVTSDCEWESWINFVLKGITETSLWTIQKIEAIAQLIENTKLHIKLSLPKKYDLELIHMIFEQPYCRISNVTDRNMMGRQAASRNLHSLVKVGVLNRIKVGRETLFVHPKLMGLLVSELHEFDPYVTPLG